MSPRAARWILWLASLAMLPLPMLLFDARVPVTRFLLLGGVTAVLIVTEGAGQVPMLALALFFVHALLYGAALWLVCGWLTRELARRAPGWLGSATVAFVLVGLAFAIGFDVYVTPFAAFEPRANLLSVLE